MAYTPPTRSPTWATDGGAVVDDPGTSKQATGWVAGEAPAADHTNWFLREQGSSIDFLLKTMAPYIAHSNKVYTGSVEFDATTPSVHRSYYSAALDTHYAVNKTDGGDTNVYTSDDGVTWAAAQNLGDVSTTSISNFVDDGTSAYIGIDEKVYKATPTTFSEVYDFTGANLIWSLAYDSVNDYLIAGGVGEIYYSNNGGTSWTTVSAPANTLEQMTTNPNTGRTIGLESGTFDIWYSDNATTWNSYALAVDYDRIFWCESIGQFVGVRTSDSLLAFSETGQTWTVRTGILAQFAINTPEFLLIYDATGTKEWFSVTGAPDDAGPLTCTVIALGSADYTNNDISPAAAIANLGIVQCGGGIIYFPDTDDELVYSQYGPVV